MQYLVKMTPLEPYCFGTDQSAPYIGAENAAKGPILSEVKRFRSRPLC